MTPHKLFAPRRIGVCGSSKDLPAEAVWFCESVGRRLATEAHVVIVSGGSRKRDDVAEGNLATDWHIVNAAAEAIQRAGRPEQVEAQIETVVGDDLGKGGYFSMGAHRRARGRTREARRFSFVRSVDALLAVAGRGGTTQELALAAELDIPLMPVPLFGGAAADFWRAYRSELVRALRIDGDTLTRWEGPAPTDRAQLDKLAVEMVGVLLDSLPRRCFVIMPFMQDFRALYDFVIEPAIKQSGDQPIRLDRAAVPGDVGRQILDGIRRCDYAIAVLDGLRTNVLYELGLAHGFGKLTVLLNRAGTLGETGATPFDLSTHQRLEYEAVDARLVSELERTLAALPARRARSPVV
jgi:hypothetical protein